MEEPFPPFSLDEVDPQPPLFVLELSDPKHPVNPIVATAMNAIANVLKILFLILLKRLLYFQHFTFTVFEYPDSLSEFFAFILTSCVPET